MTPPIELPEISIIVGLMVVAMSGLMYIIRAEIRRNGDTLRKEMAPNHGTSMRDAIDRLEAGQTRMEDHLTRIDEKHDEHISWHMGKD
jgi:hypothetical protein